MASGSTTPYGLTPHGVADSTLPLSPASPSPMSARTQPVEAESGDYAAGERRSTVPPSRPRWDEDSSDSDESRSDPDPTPGKNEPWWKPASLRARREEEAEEAEEAEGGLSLGLGLVRSLTSPAAPPRSPATAAAAASTSSSGGFLRGVMSGLRRSMSGRVRAPADGTGATVSFLHG
jgi:hypothetical protein